MPDRAALVALFHDLLARVGWISRDGDGGGDGDGKTGGGGGGIKVLAPGPSPFSPSGGPVRVYADGVQPDSYLCRLAWAACLLLALLGLRVDQVCAVGGADAEAAAGTVGSAALAANLGEVLLELDREVLDPDP